LKIASIDIKNNNIFDTDIADENSTIHKIANQLHFKTSKQTIKDQLLFEEGRFYSDKLIQETRRLVKSKRYINDVEIEPRSNCKGEVEVEVLSTDNWTLTPNVSVGHSGGVRRTSYEITESNLLGTGARLKIKSDSDKFRDKKEFWYSDGNLFGGHYSLDLQVERYSDGYLNALSLSKPFYQLSAESAWAISLSNGEIENPIYAEGEVVDSIGRETDDLNLSYGWLYQNSSQGVSRFRAGLSLTDLRYFNTLNFPSSALPSDRATNYPYIQYQFLEDRYIRKPNFLVMGQLEDISLGSNLVATLGLQDEAFKSSENGLLVNIDYSFGAVPFEDSLALFKPGLSQQLNQSGYDPAIYRFDGKMLLYDDENHSYQIASSLEVAQDISPVQTIIGEDG
jgi:hypothetical protein